MPETCVILLSLYLINLSSFSNHNKRIFTMNIILKRFFIFERATKLKRIYASILFHFVVLCLRVVENLQMPRFPSSNCAAGFYGVFLLCMYACEKRFLNGTEGEGLSSTYLMKFMIFFFFFSHVKKWILNRIKRIQHVRRMAIEAYLDFNFERKTEEVRRNARVACLLLRALSSFKCKWHERDYRTLFNFSKLFLLLSSLLFNYLP